MTRAAGFGGGNSSIELSWIIQSRCDFGERRGCHCIVVLPKLFPLVRGKKSKCEMEEKCAAGSCMELIQRNALTI